MLKRHETQVLRGAGDLSLRERYVAPTMTRETDSATMMSYDRENIRIFASSWK